MNIMQIMQKIKSAILEIAYPKKEREEYEKRLSEMSPQECDEELTILHNKKRYLRKKIVWQMIIAALLIIYSIVLNIKK